MCKYSEFQLTDKNSSEVNALLNYSFQYLLAGIAQSYSQVHGYRTIEEFNANNRLTKTLLSGYPFFVALANGHGKCLFNLFGDFENYTYGPYSKSIDKIIGSDNYFDLRSETQLDFFTIKPISIEIKNVQGISSFEKLKKAIIETQLTPLSTNKEILFVNIEIKKDTGGFTPLYQAINNAIAILNQRSNNLFFDGDMSRIMQGSLYNRALSGEYRVEANKAIQYEDAVHSD